MDDIVTGCNQVVTECGHAFHCSCLMKNAAHNGFGCPYCRTTLAEEPTDDESDDDDDGWSDVSTVFEEDTLTSFRMFHQRVEGLDVEEEEEEGDDESSVSESDDRDDGEQTRIADAAYIANKLAARGFTMEDLVKNLLVIEHSNFGSVSVYMNYENRSNEVYGQIRASMAAYKREPVAVESKPLALEVVSRVEPFAIAESKNETGSYRRREYM
jgi:hypothetical protein